MSSPARSPRSQLCSAGQVRRLSRNVDQGHGIRYACAATLAQLQAMLGSAAQQPAPLRAVAVGATLAPRLLAGGLNKPGLWHLAGPDVHVVGACALPGKCRVMPTCSSLKFPSWMPMRSLPIQRARDATDTSRACSTGTPTPPYATGAVDGTCAAVPLGDAPSRTLPRCPISAITLNEETLGQDRWRCATPSPAVSQHLAELLMMVGSRALQCPSAPHAMTRTQLHLALEQAASARHSEAAIRASLAIGEHMAVGRLNRRSCGRQT